MTTWEELKQEIHRCSRETKERIIRILDEYEVDYATADDCVTAARFIVEIVREDMANRKEKQP